MKQIKRVVSLLLCAILICALTAPAFAGNGFINLESGTFTNNQTFYNRGSFDNYGTLNNKATFDTSGGKINSYGSAKQTGVETTPVNKYYTVSFNTGGNGYVDPQTVIANGTATEPSPAPTRYGYSFEGWYSYADDTTKYDFNTPITGDITLYAKWLATSEGALYVSSAPTASIDSATGSTIYSFSGYLSGSEGAGTFTMPSTVGSAPSRGGVYSVVYYTGTAAIKTLSEVTAETVSSYNATSFSITTTANNTYQVVSDVLKYQIGDSYTLTSVSDLDISAGDTVYVPRRADGTPLGFYYISRNAFTVSWVTTSSADYGKLSWNAVSGAANYRIFKNGDEIAYAGATDTTFDLKDVIIGNFEGEGTYEITVKALDSTGGELKSSVNSLTVSHPSSVSSTASYSAVKVDSGISVTLTGADVTESIAYTYVYTKADGTRKTNSGMANSFTIDVTAGEGDTIDVRIITDSSISGNAWQLSFTYQSIKTYSEGKGFE